jgi:hypothetical protein
VSLLQLLDEELDVGCYRFLRRLLFGGVGIAPGAVFRLTFWLLLLGLCQHTYYDGCGIFIFNVIWAVESYIGVPLFRPSSLFAAAFLGLCISSYAAGQAEAPYVRRLNVNIGGAVLFAYPGIPSKYSTLYGKWNYSGGGVYATLDPHRRYGAEIAANAIYGAYVSQRTFLVGPRYYHDYGNFAPYLKAMYGRGNFRYPAKLGSANFNVLSFGGGVAYSIEPWMQVRVDYGYQRWLGFSDNKNVVGYPGALSPQTISIGFGYHIQ